MRVFLAQVNPILGDIEKNLNCMVNIIKEQLGKSDIIRTQKIKKGKRKV